MTNSEYQALFSGSEIQFLKILLISTIGMFLKFLLIHLLTDSFIHFIIHLFTY